uniref:Uncharacterized protein n=1 Tax=Cricetulus griseus TaxID=10029 RepID=A0A8C2MS61_CRIGR
MATETVELHKLKLTKGIKQDLINRLQAYLEEHAEEEANEGDVLGDKTEEKNKEAARAARFGISSVPTKGLSSDTKSMINLDKLKERAQRFGLNVSSISRKSEDDEKLNKRNERFGIMRNTEAKKRKRAEHFGIA